MDKKYYFLKDKVYKTEEYQAELTGIRSLCGENSTTLFNEEFDEGEPV